MRGNTHTFLGMNIEIKDNMLQIYMVKNLEDIIKMFGEDVSTLCTSTATRNFFEVREDYKQLSENKGEFLQLVLEKL